MEGMKSLAFSSEHYKPEDGFAEKQTHCPRIASRKVSNMYYRLRGANHESVVNLELLL
jgi:hypothetical protein